MLRTHPFKTTDFSGLHQVAHSASPRFGKHFEISLDKEFMETLVDQNQPLDRAATLGAAFVEYIARKWAQHNGVNVSHIDTQQPQTTWGNKLVGQTFAKCFQSPEGLDKLLAYVVRGDKLHIISGSTELDDAVKEAIDDARDEHLWNGSSFDSGSSTSFADEPEGKDNPFEFENSLWGDSGPPEFGSTFDLPYKDPDPQDGLNESWETGANPHSYSQYETKFNRSALPDTPNRMSLDENRVPLQGIPFTVTVHRQTPVNGTQDVMKLFEQLKMLTKL